MARQLWQVVGQPVGAAVAGSHGQVAGCGREAVAGRHGQVMGQPVGVLAVSGRGHGCACTVCQALHSVLSSCRGIKWEFEELYYYRA